MTSRNEYCILCIMHPIIIFGSLSGYYCISSFGHHHNESISATNSFRISKTKTMLTVLCIIILFYHLLHHTWLIFNMTKFSADTFVILLNEVLSCFGDLFVKIYFLVKTGNKLQMLSSYQTTLNHPSQETSGCITDAEIKYARKLQFINICAACCLLTIYLLIVYKYAEEMDLMHIIKLVTDLIILYATMVVAFQISGEIIIIYLLFYKLRSRLTKALSNRVASTRIAENVLTPISFVSKVTSRDVKQAYKQRYISKNLQRLRYFHTITMKNFKIFSSYFNSSFVNWCSFLSVILMINSYIIVTSCLNSVEASATTVISAVARFTVYISTMSLFFFHVQCIVDIVSILL